MSNKHNTGDPRDCNPYYDMWDIQVGRVTFNPYVYPYPNLIPFVPMDSISPSWYFVPCKCEIKFDGICNVCHNSGYMLLSAAEYDEWVRKNKTNKDHHSGEWKFCPHCGEKLK